MNVAAEMKFGLVVSADCSCSGVVTGSAGGRDAGDGGWVWRGHRLLVTGEGRTQLLMCCDATMFLFIFAKLSFGPLVKQHKTQRRLFGLQANIMAIFRQDKFVMKNSFGCCPAWNI